MNTMLDHALARAADGFHVFPLRANSKLPAIKDYPNKATRDPEIIKGWWAKYPNANIGISTTRYGDDEALVAVDVDMKNGHDGLATILGLEMEGMDLPATYTQHTPTGGQHLVYRSPEPMKQNAGKLGDGVDIRSKGGYLVGAGSMIDGKPYVGGNAPIDMIPAWLAGKLLPAGESVPDNRVLEGIDPLAARDRAVEYLTALPVSVAGGRNEDGYRAACQCREFGVGHDQCLDVMAGWFQASPPLDLDEIQHVVDSAYRYAREAQGAAAPEVQFTPVEPAKDDPGPVETMNQAHAFVVIGGGHHVLWETTDADGQFRLEHLSEIAFHRKHASNRMQVGDGEGQLTKVWMASPKRRSYDGICFKPGKQAPPRYYNLWRGFTVEPLGPRETVSREAEAAVETWFEHIHDNICRGDKALSNYVVTFFAHLVQEPWNKPDVALVLRGGKGVGKNAMVDRVGRMLGCHYMLAADKRYLLGNFNSHMENLLLLTLDEAFWSGDKQAEGPLKHLVTGKKHAIERKGQEPYEVDNLLRVVVLGNEEWLVPASHDERRYAIFDVGPGRQKDRGYFHAMRVGIDDLGGDRLLLRRLLDHDTGTIDINEPPDTVALLDQKLLSLDPVHLWWLDCLTDGRIAGCEFGASWPTEIDKDRFRGSFHRYLKDHNVRARFPDDRSVGRLVKQALPSLDGAGKRREGRDLVNIYRLPPIEEARRQWDIFIGHKTNWN